MADRRALSIYTDTDPYWSLTLRNFVQDDPNVPASLFDGAKPKSGGAQTPVTPPAYPVSGTGHIVPTFFNDWYFRIHFIPASLDIGNLLSNQSRTVTLWNAYLDPKLASSFALVNGDGISVVEPQPTPYMMAELALYTYTVILSTNGPPTIDASLNWTIGGVDFSVPITGRRVVVWPFPPNWVNPVDETLEWLTSVQSSYDDTEQRFAMREAPRRVFEYSMQIVGSDTGLFESVVYGWSDRLYAVPIWTERSNLTAIASVGATVLALDTTNRTFVPGGLLVLRKSATIAEAIEIISVTSTTVELKKGVERDWPVGSRVYPVMVSMLEKPTAAQYVAEDKLEGVVRFVGSPAETDTRTPINAPPVTYGGVEVYTASTNWISPIGMSYEASYDIIDSNTGVFSLHQRAGWPKIVKSHEWLNKSRTESTTVRDFFSRRRGRLVPVWMPTGTADFRLVEDASLTSNVIRVVDNDYGSLVAQHPARRNLIIMLRNGTTIIRQINDYVSEGDGTASLTVDSPIGVNITPKTVKRISFIGLYRVASDAVTFSWRTDAVSTVQSSFQLTRPAA